MPTLYFKTGQAWGPKVNYMKLKFDTQGALAISCQLKKKKGEKLSQKKTPSVNSHLIILVAAPMLP